MAIPARAVGTALAPQLATETFAVLLGLFRRERVRRNATPPTAAEALSRWLTATVATSRR